MKSAFFVLFLICSGCFSLAANGQPGSNARFTSVYTSLKDDCTFDKEPAGGEDGGDPAASCKPVGSYRLRLYYSAWAATLVVTDGEDKEIITLGTDRGTIGDKGEKLEWRLANGKPFAAIMRIGRYREEDGSTDPYTAANRTGSMLIVKGLRGYEHIDAVIDGARKNANEEARKFADAGYKKRNP